MAKWKPVELLEGIEEVWVRFYCEELDKEVCIEVCSVEDLIYSKIGDEDDVQARIQEELDELDD